MHTVVHQLLAKGCHHFAHQAKARTLVHALTTYESCVMAAHVAPGIKYPCQTRHEGVKFRHDQIRDRKWSREERPRLCVPSVGVNRLVLFLQRMPNIRAVTANGSKCVVLCCSQSDDTGDGNARGTDGPGSAAGSSVAMSMSVCLGACWQQCEFCQPCEIRSERVVREFFVRHCTWTPTDAGSFACLLVDSYSGMVGRRTSATANMDSWRVLLIAQLQKTNPLLPRQLRD